MCVRAQIAAAVWRSPEASVLPPTHVKAGQGGGGSRLRARSAQLQGITWHAGWWRCEQRCTSGCYSGSNRK